jgi:pimeloyl-ACP methyl ester carboxylesterase
MSALALSRQGAGPPLVLLHALGSSRSSWDPVVPALAERFEVLAVDLPGFGESAPLPAGEEPSPARLARSVAGLLDELRIDRPHVVGNSLGGWIALELAATRPLASLTLLAPAGLWRRGTPRYDLVSLRLTRWASRNATRTLSRLVAHPLGRILVLGQTHGRPTRVTPEQARAEIAALGNAPAFDATLAATAHRRYRADPDLGTPVTVAIGSRDLVLLPHQSRHLDQLPPGTRSAELPGCGHLPMSDDPVAVVDLITASARTGIEISHRSSS